MTRLRSSIPSFVRADTGTASINGNSSMYLAITGRSWRLSSTLSILLGTRSAFVSAPERTHRVLVFSTITGLVASAM